MIVYTIDQRKTSGMIVACVIRELERKITLRMLILHFLIIIAQDGKTTENKAYMTRVRKRITRMVHYLAGEGNRNKPSKKILLLEKNGSEIVISINPEVEFYWKIYGFTRI